MTEDADLFDTADSAAAIEAYVFSEFGADGLKELLCLVDADRESLERDAAELSAIGLPKPAEIVREHAALPTTSITTNAGSKGINTGNCAQPR